VCIVLGIELRALCILSKCSITEPHLQKTETWSLRYGSVPGYDMIQGMAHVCNPSNLLG
jgi:hypothetical protein